MLLTLSTLLPWSRGNPDWKLRVHRVDPKAPSILRREQRTWQHWGFAGTAAQQDGHDKNQHETLLPQEAPGIRGSAWAWQARTHLTSQD